MYIFPNENLSVIATETEKLLKTLPTPSNFLIVFDIDSTLLINTPFGVATSSNPCQATPIIEILRILNLALILHMKVFLVTARVDTTENRVSTLNQLRCLGITHFHGLYMRPASVGANVTNISIFKLECRRMLTSHNHKNIFLNIGDQWSDHFITTNEKNMELDNFYRNKHVLFQPPSGSFSMWSLKLFES